LVHISQTNLPKKSIRFAKSAKLFRFLEIAHLNRKMGKKNHRLDDLYKNCIKKNKNFVQNHSEKVSRRWKTFLFQLFPPFKFVQKSEIKFNSFEPLLSKAKKSFKFQIKEEIMIMLDHFNWSANLISNFSKNHFKIYFFYQCYKYFLTAFKFLS